MSHRSRRCVATIEPGATSWANAGRAIRSLVSQLKSCLCVFAAALREIFDEAAYARFLNQKELISSRAAYAAFRREYEATKARRPRCC
jgi:hypothetical protein